MLLIELILTYHTSTDHIWHQYDNQWKLMKQSASQLKKNWEWFNLNNPQDNISTRIESKFVQ